jgi:hypothetical protein
MAQRGEPGTERLGEAHAAHHEAEGESQVPLDDQAWQPEGGGDRKRHWRSL